MYFFYLFAHKFSFFACFAFLLNIWLYFNFGFFSSGGNDDQRGQIHDTLGGRPK